jgi:ligand-binding sensor domain-containing protein
MIHWLLLAGIVIQGRSSQAPCGKCLPGFNLSTGVTSLLIDRKGTAWVGTAGQGLLIIEGTCWSVCTTANSGIPDDKVSALAAEPGGALWVGGQFQGLARLGAGRWTRPDKHSDVEEDGVECLLFASDGILWVGSDYANGLLRFDGKTWRVALAGDTLPMAINDFEMLAETKGGSIWTAERFGETLARLGEEGWVEIFRTPATSMLDEEGNSPLPDHLYSLAGAPDGSLWIASGDGVARLFCPPGKDLITLHCIQRGRWKFFTEKDGLFTESLDWIQVARDGTVWAASRDGGVTQYSGSKWKTARAEQENETVEAFVLDPKGSAWMAVARGCREAPPESQCRATRALLRSAGARWVEIRLGG